LVIYYINLGQIELPCETHMSGNETMKILQKNKSKQIKKFNSQLTQRWMIN